ncbi:MAG: methyltransferase domain-containing protein [Actinobacteria bacterium]|nr:MAG: methyltransferase domain-containing protein [Actinomycetota bacterium]
MLTVDYDRLGLGAGDRLLDLGCGGGRHAFEALRRGARVVALDRDQDELFDALTIIAAMDETGETAPPGAGAATRGDALALPFPDATFDRVIAAEVLEHIPADTAALAELVRVLRPGGTIAVTVPRWLPERICWALSDEYHGKPGGHIRIYKAGLLDARMSAVGLDVTGSHHAHALHSPYWWIKCAVGVDNDRHVLARLYHRFLAWEITNPTRAVRVVEHALDPLIGKSLVMYATKPAAAPARPKEPARAAA